MCREQFSTYQLLEDCLAAKTVDQVRAVVAQGIQYRIKGDYSFDPFKAKRVGTYQVFCKYFYILFSAFNNLFYINFTGERSGGKEEIRRRQEKTFRGAYGAQSETREKR